MNYSFDIRLAKKFGVEEAIMLSNFQFWILKNKANEKHLHEGKTWTYNSIKSFAKLFPFWSEKQIRRILDSLIKQGVIQTGNFNNSQYDRTIWYCFVDETKWLSEKVNTTSEKSKMDMPIWANGFSQTGKPIPDNKPDNKPDTLVKESEVVEKWNEFAEKNNLQKISKLTNKRISSINHRLQENDFDLQKILEKISQSDFLLGKKSSWKVTFDFVFCSANNYIKILEGNYANTNTAIKQIQTTKYTGFDGDKYKRLLEKNRT